ncbi:MAG TPA: hypothetical protein VMC84_07735 [Methanocella sp.]|uniref:hypothetical protein n=1 Tax=Methanocella sp. TaxID=2052833 RepID=UPI002CFC720C|nr:hypothetical protein [Methanocella sp.]HTY91049.1 hypothetical protein [Methanocella sp.]
MVAIGISDDKSGTLRRFKLIGRAGVHRQHPAGIAFMDHDMPSRNVFVATEALKGRGLWRSPGGH